MVEADSSGQAPCVNRIRRIRNIGNHFQQFHDALRSGEPLRQDIHLSRQHRNRSDLQTDISIKCHKVADGKIISDRKNPPADHNQIGKQRQHLINAVADVPLLIHLDRKLKSRTHVLEEMQTFRAPFGKGLHNADSVDRFSQIRGNLGHFFLHQQGVLAYDLIENKKVDEKHRKGNERHREKLVHHADAERNQPLEQRHIADDV